MSMPSLWLQPPNHAASSQPSLQASLSLALALVATYTNAQTLGNHLPTAN